MSIHVEKFNVVGTFPVTQQILGTACFGYGLVKAVANIAKLIFHGIKKLLTEAKSNDMIALNFLIEKDIKRLGKGGNCMAKGLITLTPIVGTIFNGIIWYKDAHYIRLPPGYSKISTAALIASIKSKKSTASVSRKDSLLFLNFFNFF